MQKFTRSVVPTSKKTKDQVFAFDRVFDENTTQSDVYEGTTKNLLDSVLDGYNATVFAYGATGCGKTHTITGTAQHPGIIFLTMQELFEKIEERSQEKTTELTLSYLEIYNETIRDLLLPGGSKTGLMLREDSHQAVTVAGLTSHHPRDVQEVMDMIVQGNEYRTVSPTEANATSSRSHAVLQINVAQKDRNADINEPHTMATLSIIDLAGSERASVTKNRGERLTEGANINKSLLALGSCINALCDRRQRAHVPYRNSKLTRLLKFSLGGNCKTVMIVCVSPSSAHFDETQNTLRYANRAKNIQTKVTRNVFNVNRHVKDFLVKIDEQMALINELKALQKDVEAISFAKFRKQWEKRDMTAREGVQRLRTAYENSAAERQERINSMKKLRAFERRIGLLSSWIAAYDTVCEQRDDGSIPQSLTAVRKTARGILAELENSRQHLHQKLEHASWERHIDTALSHSLKQLEAMEGAETGEMDRLTREAELLKSEFDREAQRDMLEQEKAGDAALLQMLLTAQFEMLFTLDDVLAMDEESAVAHARKIINGLLQTGAAAASQVVKPDGSLPVVEVFPPTRRGTPKRKKAMASYAKPIPVPTMAAVHNEHLYASPLKSSPRRRKALGPAKKGVSFTPVKKAPRARGVRWRDDESEEGTLADFANTPKKLRDSPSDLLCPERDTTPRPAAAAAPTHDEIMMNEESRSSLKVPEAASLGPSKPARFLAGFLAKGSRLSTLGDASPQAPSLSLELASPSRGDETCPPLQTLDVIKIGNFSPKQQVSRVPKLSPQRVLDAIMDENAPPTNQHSSSGSGSDSEASTLDPKKLRSAMSSFKKDKARRASTQSGTTASNAKRVSSIGSLNGDKHMPRPSMPGSLASNTNGISRNRRGSMERRRSPPLSCSPSEWKAERAFTAGQARRMNLGGSLRVEGTSGSPREGAAADGQPRRVTIGMGIGGGHRRQESRGSSAWR